MHSKKEFWVGLMSADPILKLDKEIPGKFSIIKPLQLKLLKGMLMFDDIASEGWQYVRPIMKKGSFGSQINNFRNYIAPLVTYGLVQERMFKEPDKRNRIPKKGKKQYRLKPDLNTFNAVEKIFHLYGIKNYDLFNNYFEIVAKNVGSIKLNQHLAVHQQAEYYLALNKEKQLKQELEKVQNKIKKLENKLEVKR